jgi:hypothetical protein
MTTEKELYAPSQPFADAINEWCITHRCRLRDEQLRGISHAPHWFDHPGLEQLAVRANIPARSLRGYVNGERQLITLTNADRLSMALGTSLWVLAPWFGSRRNAMKRVRAANRRAERKARAAREQVPA